MAGRGRRGRLKTLARYAKRKPGLWLKRRFPVFAAQIMEALGELGVERGDSLFVHVSLDRMPTFTGEPFELISGLCDAVGEEGNVLMPTFPLAGPMHAHLLSGAVFDVCDTPSRMGLVTELFRQLAGVTRSVHPTHPVAVWGKDARWLTRDHHRDDTAWGPNSPFQRLMELGGKAVLFGTTLRSCTIAHVAESKMRDGFPLDVFTDEPFESVCRDERGDEVVVKTYPTRPGLSEFRDPNVFWRALKRRGILAERRVGRFAPASVAVVDANGYVDFLIDQAEQGKTFYRRTVRNVMIAMLRGRCLSLEGKKAA